MPAGEKGKMSATPPTDRVREIQQRRQNFLAVQDLLANSPIIYLAIEEYARGELSKPEEAWAKIVRELFALTKSLAADVAEARHALYRLGALHCEEELARKARARKARRKRAAARKSAAASPL
jgi:hypothetical protein